MNSSLSLGIPNDTLHKYLPLAVGIPEQWLIHYNIIPISHAHMDSFLQTIKRIVNVDCRRYPYPSANCSTCVLSI